MEKEKRIKPKQYSHIDYEALLIYTMKKHIPLEKAIKENGLTIARSTVLRNIKKMKEEKDRNLDIINFYQNTYVPNCQTLELPRNLIRVINTFPEREVVVKNELEDVYKKLYIMNEIVEACDGNMAEAAKKINSGETPLGKVKTISRQGLSKDISYFKKVKILMEEKMKEKQEKKGEEK